MTVNAKVVKNRRVNVKVKTSDGAVTGETTATVAGLPVSPTTRLDSLDDVNASGEIAGAVPRYDPTQDKYIVEKLGFSDLTGDPGDISLTEIDGGTF